MLPAGEGRFSYEGLDRVMHEKARLGILASLAAHAGGLLFNDLKQLCSLTDGNLSRHLAVLSEAGLVETGRERKDHDRKPCIGSRPVVANGLLSTSGSGKGRCRCPVGNTADGQPATFVGRLVTSITSSLFLPLSLCIAKRSGDERSIMRVIRAEEMGMCFGVRDACR